VELFSNGTVHQNGTLHQNRTLHRPWPSAANVALQIALQVAPPAVSPNCRYRARASRYWGITASVSMATAGFENPET